MQYEATAKYLRISTRKLRLLARAIKSLSVAKATMQVTMLPKAASGMMKKVLDAAIDSAKQKHADETTLRILRIEVMGGPMMKRFHAVSRGMAHSYKKRMSHVRVILTDEPKKSKEK